VSSISHLATEAPPRRAIDNALKASRVLALVILLQFVADLTNSSDPLTGKYVRSRVSVHDLFGSLLDTVDIGGLACALFPADATNVAELGLAGASAIG
jgi:hypothetical protein